MKQLQRAIVFLQQARDMIEEDAHFRDLYDPDRMDLEDVASDLGAIIHTLESFGGKL